MLMPDPPPARILIVDDERAQMKALCDTLRDHGYETVGLTNGQAALAALREAKFDLLLTDLVMPEMDGISLLRAALELDPDIIGIIMTGEGTIDTAVEAMKTGALDYILKPFKLSVILPVLSRALAMCRLRLQNVVLERQVRDLDAQRHAAELRRAILDALPANIAVLDRAGVIISVNERWRQFALGNAFPDATFGVGANYPALCDAIAGEDATSARAAAAGIRGVLSGERDRYEAEYSCHSPSTQRWFRLMVAPLSAGHTTGAVVMHIDISAQKSTEAQLLRVQRLDSLGTLAGGITHDLNNVLAPVLICAAMLRPWATVADAREMLDTIEASAHRGADLVKQLLVFARGREGHRGLMQLRHLHREMGRLMHETFPKSIQTRVECPLDLWPVEGDTTQLHQVLLNLCVNARDAMPGGGALTLSATNVTLAEADVAALPDARPGPFVLVQVADTGAGLSGEVLARIFEPFFTTKGPGGGGGLGLSTVLNIVRGHQGAITVHSEPGRGAVFKVYLPARPGASVAEAPAEPPRSAEGRGEQVLVVDDEPALLQFVARTLDQHGYRPLHARDGTEALTLFLQHHDTIQAVFTDLMMPFLDGYALIRALRRVEPSVPILASTGALLGEAQPDRHAELAELGVTSVLAKPFKTEELLRALRDALDARPERKAH